MISVIASLARIALLAATLPAADADTITLHGKLRWVLDECPCPAYGPTYLLGGCDGQNTLVVSDRIPLSSYLGQEIRCAGNLVTCSSCQKFGIDSITIETCPTTAVPARGHSGVSWGIVKAIFR